MTRIEGRLARLVTYACAALCIPLATASPAQGGASEVQLTVVVRSLRSAKGNLAVALFRTPDSFPDRAKAFRGKVQKLTGKSARVGFERLPPGVYAIAVLHDENANNKMDFSWLGMPQEGYGFSRDAAVRFGPPSFDEAAITLERAQSEARIEVRYFEL